MPRISRCVHYGSNLSYQPERPWKGFSGFFAQTKFIILLETRALKYDILNTIYKRDEKATGSGFGAGFLLFL
ncbi:hypothetical protein D3Z50_05540 [Clostridiaceae bacterium]|nr:hypothetical protein [Clostridiaceae bacterium]